MSVSNKYLDNLMVSWMEDDIDAYDNHNYLSEQQAVNVCYEDFLKSVDWFCRGIRNGAPQKSTEQKKYAKWLLLEFARRIDKEEI